MAIFGWLEHAKRHTGQFSDLNQFEQLFNSHYGNMCSYAYKYLENLEDAEEIVQDVFVKLWENRNEIVIDGNLQSYIFRAVRNGCLNLIKHRIVRQEYATKEQQSNTIMQQNLENEIVANELEIKIREAIDALPVERKKVFIMSRYEGLKYREIAEKLNISNKTVENQMGKAILFMKERLSKYLVIFFIILSIHV